MDYNVFRKLVDAYIANYKRENEIADSLAVFGIVAYEQSNPLVTALEEIFNKFHPSLTEYILNYAESGEFYFPIDDEHGVKIRNISDLYTFVVEKF